MFQTFDSDTPLLEPRQVARTFTFYGCERLAKLVIWESFQFRVCHDSKANHKL